MQPELTQFNEMLWAYYAAHGRHDLPWRQPMADERFDPYMIMVSEIMLQQTQVSRVIPKFQAFLATFPSVHRLADAPLSDVLVAWSGLGYNRRAKFLWSAAQQICAADNARFPADLSGLVALPGIGKNTAGAILAYAYNQPAVFIETNVRTVYIHHFFTDVTAVPDAEIVALLEQTVDREHPREFYWALMDYGSHLKRTVGNASKFSQTYVKQSAFVGSRRQIRGQVLRYLAAASLTHQVLQQHIPDERLPGVLDDLVREALIKHSGDRYSL